MPPSAMTGTSASSPRSTASMIAVSCGTPTPATMRVVQIEPGPMPTLTASAPASISALRALGGGDVAGDDLDGVGLPLDARRRRRARAVEWPCAVSTTITSTPASISASVRSKPLSPTVVAAATRRRPCSSLQASGMGDRLLHVLDGDQADAAIVLVDHEQLLDAVLVQQPLRLVLADALAHRDEASRASSARRPAARGSVAKRTSRLVRMPTSLPGLPCRAGRPPGCRRCRCAPSARARRRASRRG